LEEAAKAQLLPAGAGELLIAVQGLKWFGVGIIQM
jgi:hypothetical protein